MATAIYMQIIGPGGQQVKGDVQLQGLEHTIEVRALEHEVALPNYRSNVISGRSDVRLVDSRREHGAIKILKRIDPSTPTLYKFVCGGKDTLIQKLMLRHFRQDDDGEEREYYTVELEEVKVVSVKSITHNVFSHDANASEPHCEEVAFKYGKITWKFEGGYEYSDVWNRP